MSEEMNKEAEVQEDAVDIPVTDGSEEEAAEYSPDSRRGDFRGTCTDRRN